MVIAETEPASAYDCAREGALGVGTCRKVGHILEVNGVCLLWNIFNLRNYAEKLIDRIDLSEMFLLYN